MRFFRNLKALQTPLNTALLLAYFQAHSGPPRIILNLLNHLKISKILKSNSIKIALMQFLEAHFYAKF